jgi:hypothetical protein
MRWQAASGPSVSFGRFGARRETKDQRLTRAEDLSSYRFEMSGMRIVIAPRTSPRL